MHIGSGYVKDIEEWSRPRNKKEMERFLGLLKIHQPGETVMVCPDREMPPQQVMPKLSREPNNCQ
jgi:hypothetical protein